MPTLSKQSTSSSNRSANTVKDTKQVVLEDEWNSYKIQFSIFDQNEEDLSSQGDYMSLVGMIKKPLSNGSN